MTWSRPSVTFSSAQLRLLASGDERDAEILAPLHQILVLQRQINRPRFSDTDRTILAVLSGPTRLSWVGLGVS